MQHFYKNLSKTIISILLLAASTLASAQALQQLENFLQNSKGGTATFTQTVATPAKQENQPMQLKKSSGSFSFLRPNLFKFYYQQPFEQSIISDGDYLWVYDIDLEQVTKQPLNQALLNSPISQIIKVKNITQLKNDFNIKAVNSPNGEKIELTPKQTDQQITKMLISFSKQQIKTLEIFNSFAQHSILDFNYSNTNGIPNKKDFVFKAPTNISIIDNSIQDKGER